MLTLDSPDDPVYSAVQSIKEDLSEAAAIASERANMILRADEDPKNEWPALTLYEEKKRQGKGDAKQTSSSPPASCRFRIPGRRNHQASPSLLPCPFRPRPFLSGQLPSHWYNHTQLYIFAISDHTSHLPVYPCTSSL
jgi:hypothetical protein